VNNFQAIHLDTKIKILQVVILQLYNALQKMEKTQGYTKKKNKIHDPINKENQSLSMMKK